MDSKTIIEAQSRLADLKARANRVGYKCELPTLPTFKKEHPGVHKSQMMGFNGRLYNWEKGLLQFEHPGGMPHSEPLNETQISEGVKLIVEK
jgi:hypothetical protein